MKNKRFHIIQGALIYTTFVFSKAPLLGDSVYPANSELSKAIEKHLGFSEKAYKIAVQNFFNVTNTSPDIFSFWLELRAINETKNLTAASFIAPIDDMSIRLSVSNNISGKLRGVLENNLIAGQTTLLNIDGVSNIVITRVVGEKFEGRFDWKVSNITKGQCNFVYANGKLEYLGIARDNSIGVYDCFHVFKDDYDAVDLMDWMVRQSYAVIRVADEAFARSFSNDKYNRKFFLKSHLSCTYAFPIGTEDLYVIVSDSREELNKAEVLFSEKFSVDIVERGVVLKEKGHTSNIPKIEKTLRAKYSKD